MNPHLPARPEPEDCESLSFDAYSGFQMLSYGRACFDVGYAAGKLEAEEQHAASQSREKVLRDALAECYRQLVCLAPDSEIRNAVNMAIKALSQPTDDSALKAALETERERCAKVCESRRRTVSNGNGTSYWSHEPASVEAGHCADDIRKMGDE